VAKKLAALIPGRIASPEFTGKLLVFDERLPKKPSPPLASFGWLLAARVFLSLKVNPSTRSPQSGSPDTRVHIFHALSVTIEEE